MSDNPILIIIHGIGDHTDESFKEEVVNAANNALNRYESYSTWKFQDKVNVIPISYNHIFEEMRDEFTEGNFSKVTTNSPLISLLTKLLEKLKEDDFLNTHVLDVPLYLSNVGEWVRHYVGEKITQIVHDNPNKSIHILSHSLGTVLLTNILSKIMLTSPVSGGPSINPNKFKFDSIWMFANVSRLVNNYSGMADPYNCIVKPGDSGCTHMFFNIRHVLDPVARPMMFNPDWTDHCYYNIITRSISRKNTHDIGGYIEDPLVSIPFLRCLVTKFNPTDEEISEGNKNFITINSEYAEIEKKFNHINNLSDLKDFLKLLKDFWGILIKS